jgi:Sulfotransferase family
MIYINHNLQAIFIHIPKTGGSYIGPTLVKYYGFTCYNDLLSKRRPDHDIVCEPNGFKTGNEIYDSTFLNKTMGILSYCKTSEYLCKCMEMDETKWNTYTIFCFIRHPYDRLLSGWTHIQKVFGYKMTLKEYLNRDPNSVSNIEYAHIFLDQRKHIQNPDEECGVNIIGRFEHLEQDFRQILKKIGIQNIVHIPQKVNVSRPGKTEFVFIDFDVIKKANVLFENDFNAFHYLAY